MTIKPVYHDCYIFGLVIKKKNLYYEEINVYAKALSIVFEMGKWGGGDADLKKPTLYPNLQNPNPWWGDCVRVVNVLL